MSMLSNRKKRTLIRAERWGFLAFFLPALVFYAVFKYFPIFYSGVLSFAKWNFIGELKWIGFKNYVDMFSKSVFVMGVSNTLKYIAAFFPFFVVVPLFFATILLAVRSPRAQVTYKAMLFLPTVLALSIVCMVWLWIYSPSFGVINLVLKQLGMKEVSWLSEKATAFWAIVVACGWKFMGQNLILFMAGLLNIPQECIEASHIDGASAWQCFWRIKMPLLAPITVYVVTTSIIFAADRAFTAINILTAGGPSYTTTNLAYVIYEFAFKSYNIGMASAIAVFTSLFYLLITLVMMRSWGGFDRDA